MSGSWLQNSSVIYHVLIDRFAGYDEHVDDMKVEWVGGNLSAIIDKLDYLCDLGVNALLLSPFFSAKSYHGYDVVDFHSVDPHFGKPDDLKNLVDACHQKNLRVIADFVPNHCSVEHPFFVDAAKKPSSKYREWFYFTDWPNEYLTFFGFRNLPKFNLDNPEARDYVLSVARYWIEQFNLDGYRLDHAPGASNSFWKALRGVVKKAKSDAVLVGEVAIDEIDHRLLNTIMMDSVRKLYDAGKKVPESVLKGAVKEYVDIFDGCLNFEFSLSIERFLRGELTKNQALKVAKDYEDKLPDSFALPVFLDNHDRNRILYATGQSEERLKEVARMQFSMRQPKIIYYGTEVGMTHEKEVTINTGVEGSDLPARLKMQWDPKQQNQKLLEFYRQLIADNS